MIQDPLSDLLELVQVRCSISTRLVAGGDWARRFANLDAIKLCAAVEGSAWSFMEGMAAPARFAAGDVLVMNGARALILASDEKLIDGAVTTPLRQDEGGVYRLGRGEGFMMLSGAVLIDERQQPLLLSGLPPMLHVHGNQPEATTLSWLLDQIVREMEPGPRPGQSFIMAELSQLMFVQTLRAYLASAPADENGWLKGLGDKRLAPALNRIHAEPRRDWNLEELASIANMSRTTFAVRFRKMMGMPPHAYITKWRMHRAERDLRAGTSMAEVAYSAGYKSESAFAHAFKRTMGIAPGRCRKVSEDDNKTRAGHLQEAAMDAF